MKTPTQPKFKIGDIVKVIGNTPTNPAGPHVLNTGTITTIKRINNDKEYCQENAYTLTDHSQFVLEKDLRFLH